MIDRCATVVFKLIYVNINLLPSPTTISFRILPGSAKTGQWYLVITTVMGPISCLAVCGFGSESLGLVTSGIQIEMAWFGLLVHPKEELVRLKQKANIHDIHSRKRPNVHNSDLGVVSTF